MAHQIRSACDNGIGSYRVGGRVTMTNASTILAHNDEWLALCRAQAQVVCYTGARIEVDPDLLCRAALAAASGPPGVGLQAPTALVVAPDALGFWRDYCRLAALGGLPRAAFTRREDARRWACEQAALWAAQRTHRSRGR